MSTQTSYQRIVKERDSLQKELAELKRDAMALLDAFVDLKAENDRLLVGKAVGSGELGFLRKGLDNLVVAGQSGGKHGQSHDVSASVAKRIAKGAK